MIDFIMMYYAIASLTVALPACAVGIGQSNATTALIDALDQQPAAHTQLKFLFFLGMAMLEFIGILAVFVGLMLLSNPPQTDALFFSHLGAALSLLLPSIAIGLSAAYPLAEIFGALARQPFLYPQLLRQLLFTQIMLQTPTLFGFVITLLLFGKSISTLSLAAGIQLCAAGLMFGLGVLGPILGIAIFATEACRCAGLKKDNFDRIFAFTLISQGVIETPVLLVVMLSLFICFSATSSATYAGLIYLATALSMGCVNLATGINSGLVARRACTQIDKNPGAYGVISNASLISQTFVETTTIYGMIIVFMILLSLPS